jgi:group I intron endonuclease
MKDTDLICGIYKISSPSGAIYIGQAKDINKRWKRYRVLDCKTQIKLFNSFKKHGIENHVFEIIEVCAIEELNEKEKHYISLFKSFKTENGMNLTKGGNYITQESILKMRLSYKGKTGNRKGAKHSEEAKVKISLIHKGNKYNLGRKSAIEIKEKIAIAKMGNNCAKKRPISQYLKNGIKIREFASISDASRATKILITSIANNLKTRSKTAGGYIWEYSTI